MGLLDRLAPRRTESDPSPASPAAVDDPVFATKALRKFLTALTSRESPVLLDLGPVVGSNVSFFGEQLGCKIFVEDIFADLDRHVRDGKLDALPEFLQDAVPAGRRHGRRHPLLGPHRLPRSSRRRRRSPTELTRVLRPEGALLGFFGTAQPRDARYTKYIIVDEVNLKHRPYPAARGRQAILLNRDIIRLFAGLARLRFVPAAEQPPRDPLPQARLRRPLTAHAMARPVIALLTDFGPRDHYVGTMKGVALGICPDATLVDISHDVPPHDVLAGALELAACVPLLSRRARSFSSSSIRASARRGAASPPRPATTGSSRPTMAC